MDADTAYGLQVLADNGFAEVGAILVELADDDSVSPAVYDKVCRAVFMVLDAWAVERG